MEEKETGLVYLTLEPSFKKEGISYFTVVPSYDENAKNRIGTVEVELP